jgi:hypothetical protein
MYVVGVALTILIALLLGGLHWAVRPRFGLLRRSARTPKAPAQRASVRRALLFVGSWLGFSVAAGVAVGLMVGNLAVGLVTGFLAFTCSIFALFAVAAVRGDV